MPKSRLECCLAIKKFVEFAVAEHRQPQAFLISEKDYLELRGADGKRRKKAVLTDDEMMKLIQLLPESWSNVVKISRVFGVRPWEISFIKRANNDDGEPQLRIIKGKTYNNRAGVKEETEPRWLEPVAVNGTTFDLVQNWDQLSLPPTVSGKTLGAFLRRLPYWQGLMREYQARGEWLRPYSFRDTFSVRAHSFNISDTNIAQAMGHTVEVHHRSYRTSEWKAVRSAFAQAS
jgi:integrase